MGFKIDTQAREKKLSEINAWTGVLTFETTFKLQVPSLLTGTGNQDLPIIRDRIHAFHTLTVLDVT